MEITLEQVYQELHGLRTDVDRKFAVVDGKFTAMDKKMDDRFIAMDKKMDGKFDSIDNKFSAMKTWGINLFVAGVVLIGTMVGVFTGVVVALQ